MSIDPEREFKKLMISSPNARGASARFEWAISLTTHLPPACSKCRLLPKVSDPWLGAGLPT